MIRSASVAAALAALILAAPVAAQPISARDTFPIGTGGSLVCSAQVSALDRVFGTMFDRGYQVVCRDAAAPVARLYALRLRAGDPAPRLSAARDEAVLCSAPPDTAALAELGPVTRQDCQLRAADVGYRIYTVRRGDTLYVAEGLTGYDNVLALGLRSLIADRVVPGDLEIAVTGAGDPAAFARAQAGTLDPRRALLEAYRRNNAGDYAESGEFFAALNMIEEPATRAEAVVNQALQASNLGRYAEAEALFSRATTMSGTDPVLRRRLRNYQALHLVNMGELAGALAELDRPLDQMREQTGSAEPVIDAMVAQELNVEAAGRDTLDAASGTLRPVDKIAILDGQQLQLRGTILRLMRRHDEADPILRQAFSQLAQVRRGVVAATVWMRAQILAELGAIAEARSRPGEAEQAYRDAVQLLEQDYPGSAALLSARARLASFHARSGQREQALTLYRALIEASIESGVGSAVVRRALEPYFTLLTDAQAPADASAAMLLASQVALRPGLAQTQAVLARELSGGSDEASRLFRQSVALTRDIERARVQIARAQSAASPDPAAIAELEARLAAFQQAQVQTQARLAAFPRYRVVAGGGIRLPELQQALRPGEAYYKLIVLGRSVFAMLVTPDTARAFRLTGSADDLERQVDTLRATISLVEDGEIVTYPFDVETASDLYATLFGPVAAELASIRHLIFEPDGAMLRLPPNLLVEDPAGIESYRRRAEGSSDAAFDFTGIAWFGRNRDISTAVSAAGFRDVRAAAPSRAANEYLGFGENAPITEARVASGGVRRMGAAEEGCGWAFTAWNRPIAADELIDARRAIAGAGGRAEIVTGPAFTDTAILARSDLDQYRIMHFATHGLVTPPRPDCPARPSLLTSFGDGDSDGLLSFSEIFDLRLDADLIILSACDTAGRADLVATEEAGLTTGGDFAFDGLVRAFVGAGGRLVVASHWPVPDSYDATERLIGGLFTAPAGMGTAPALRAAQRSLMDRPETSHPYYWSAFAVVGDGASPVVRPRTQSADPRTE
jgi:CHAT domain-containing protein